MWLTDNSAQNTIKTLRDIGWQGMDFATLNDGNDLEGVEVEITTEVETYEGNDYEKVRFVNKPGHFANRGVKAMDANQARAVVAKYNALLRNSPKPCRDGAETRAEGRKGGCVAVRKPRRGFALLGKRRGLDLPLFVPPPCRVVAQARHHGTLGCRYAVFSSFSPPQSRGFDSRSATSQASAWRTKPQRTDSAWTPSFEGGTDSNKDVTRIFSVLRLRTKWPLIKKA